MNNGNSQAARLQHGFNLACRKPGSPEKDASSLCFHQSRLGFCTFIFSNCRQPMDTWLNISYYKILKFTSFNLYSLEVTESYSSWEISEEGL